MKKKRIVPDSVTWKKICNVNQRRKGEKFCQLCTTEKVYIASADRTTSLNCRSEVMQKCRHKEELVLANTLQIRSAGRRQVQRRNREDSGEEEDLGEMRQEEGEDGEDQEEGGQELDVNSMMLRSMRRNRTNYTQFF